jgi:hypothetical protein
MRNGLISRQVQPAGQVFRRTNRFLFHAEILTRAVPRARIEDTLPNFHFQISILSSRPCPSGQFFSKHCLYHALKSQPAVMRIMN